VTDAYYGRAPWCSTEQRIEVRLGCLIERRGRLIQEKDSWLIQKNPRKGEPLLFAKREALRGGSPPDRRVPRE
jgi:hypothetical protein